MQPSPLIPPTLRDDLPRYPAISQWIRITAATVAGPSGVAQLAGSSVLGPILYVAFTQQTRNDSLLPRDREPCLAHDINGRGLTPGFYDGRLVNSFNGLPVYSVGNQSVSGGGIRAQKNSTGTTYGPQPIVNLIEGTSITLTVAEDANNKRINVTIASSGGGADEKFKITSNDTTADYALNKLTSDGTLVYTEVNDGGDEDLQIKRAAIVSKLDIPAGSNDGRATPSLATRTWALDTAYQPSTTNDVLVILMVTIEIAGDGINGADGDVEFLSDSSNPPTTVRGQWNAKVSAGVVLGAHSRTFTVVGICKKDHYYKILTRANIGVPVFGNYATGYEWAI